MNSDGVEAETEQVAGRAIGLVVGELDQLRPEASEVAGRALTSHDVRDVRDEEWYSLQAFRAALEEVWEATNPDAVRPLGRAVANDPDLVACGTVPEAMAKVDDVYRELHRGDAGGYGFRRIGERDGRVECETPYPCPFDRGFVEGVANAGADGVVRLSEVGLCRDEGGDRCTFELRW